MHFLSSLTQQFVQQTGYTPLVSGEIEFYLPSYLPLAKHNQQLGRSGIETYGLEPERGDNQYELALKNPTNPLQAAEQITALKNLFLEGNFAAKPYTDQPGSGLHIHFSLLDKQGKNPFAKTGAEEETAIMRQVVAGLLDSLLEGFAIFAPLEESYARFSTLPLREGVYNNAPINVSWGGNNRTTALRIPTSTAWPQNRHIEHRVAGADADPFAVIAAILLGAQRGLLEAKEPPPKIWGNAADPQYVPLPPFPKTLEEARKIYNKTGLYDPIRL